MPEKECICIKGKESEEGTIPFTRDPNCPIHGDSSNWFKSEKIEEVCSTPEGLKRVAEAMANPPRCGGQDYINGIPILPCGRRFHLTTKKDYEELPIYFKIDPKNIFIKEGTGSVTIIVYKQRFRMWWCRKRIGNLIEQNKCLGIQVEIALSIFGFLFDPFVIYRT